jgi:hypothetical protein
MSVPLPLIVVDLSLESTNHLTSLNGGVYPIVHEPT